MEKCFWNEMRKLCKDKYTTKELNLLFDHIADFDDMLETLTDEERGR